MTLIAIGVAPDARRMRSETGLTDLAAERIDGMERAIVHRHDFVAEQNARPMRGRAFDDSGYERAALIVGLGEHANSGIGHVRAREDPIEAAMLERACENVGELVIGGILGRIIMSVGGVELGQHRVDYSRSVLT